MRHRYEPEVTVMRRVPGENNSVVNSLSSFLKAVVALGFYAMPCRLIGAAPDKEIS
jgi:hypothetical protein